MADPKSSPLMPLGEARQRILTDLSPLPGSEQLPLRSALGRVLAAPLISPIDVPSYVNSAMDGYAIRAGDLPQSGEVGLTVIGESFAGHAFEGTLAATQAVRIMTGAPLPQGADSVVIQERVRREGETVFVPAGVKLGANVRLAGEDLTRGERVLEAGKRLLPPELGLIASLGIPEVRVTRRPRIAFFSTGDELRSLGEPLGSGEIYDSNRYTLHGMLSRLGVELLDLGVIPDQREAVHAAFEQAAAMADVVITSGGVSVGEADYVKEALEALGEVRLWKIAMKPGKPLAFGRLRQAWFFGLPGNPVSAMVTFYQIVQPALRRLMGEEQVEPISLHLPCTTALKKEPGRLDFQRGQLQRDANGQLSVRATGSQGSHILRSMSLADCFIVLPAESGSVEAGSLVEVQPFAGMM